MCFHYHKQNLFYKLIFSIPISEIKMDSSKTTQKIHYGSCFSFISGCCDKVLCLKQLKEERVCLIYDPWLQLIIVSKSRQQELEAVNQITFVVKSRGQWINACMLVLKNSLFSSSPGPTLEIQSPTFRAGLLTLN